MPRDPEETSSSSSEEEEYDEDEKEPKKKPFWKKVMRFMFSHIGLFIMLFIYVGLGALIFMAIEGGSNDKSVTDAPAYKMAVEAIKNETLAAIRATKDKATIKLELEKFDEKMDELSNTYGHVDKATALNGEKIETGWQFASSMLFAVSIITLIGYGHIYPVTTMGMITVILYSLLGIPLTLMFLANVGELMATFVRKVTGKIRNLGRKDAVADVDSSKPPSVFKTYVGVLLPVSITIFIMVSYIMLGAVLFWAWEGWTIVVGTYFCFQTLTTIGFGDFSPGWDSSNAVSSGLELFASSVYIFIGLAIIAMGLNLVADEIIKSTKLISKRIGLYDDEDPGSDRDQGNIERAVRRKRHDI